MAKKQTFESAFIELESIVSELESGSPDLDKMFKLFKNGILLTRYCRKQLSEVEDRISTLIEDGDKLIEKPGVEAS